MESGYYKINGKETLLYFDGNEWFKPEKNGYVSRLKNQPKIKSLILIKEA